MSPPLLPPSLTYADPSTPMYSPSATRAALALTLVMLGSFIMFSILRSYQLSLPDSSNNPYADLSTDFLLTVPAVWIADLVALIKFRGRISRGVTTFAAVALGLFAALIALFLIGFLMFMFP